MATPTPAVRSHAWRMVRFPVFAGVAAALIDPMIHDAAIRWPALGAVIGVLEIIARTIAPTVPAPLTSAVPPPPSDTS